MVKYIYVYLPEEIKMVAKKTTMFINAHYCDKQQVRRCKDLQGLCCLGRNRDCKESCNCPNNINAIIKSPLDLSIANMRVEDAAPDLLKFMEGMQEAAQKCEGIMAAREAGTAI